MHGDHLRYVRSLYGETQPEFGKRLGFVGPVETVRRKVRRFERGEQPIAGTLAALLRILEELAPKQDARRPSNRISQRGRHNERVS